MCAVMKNQKVQKYLAVITIFASTTPASGAVLKFMAQRSLAAVSAQTDPHCSSGIVSLKKFPDDKGTHSCCAGYCGACNDYDSCKSIRGQASEYACCASKVYERRCGNAPANVCLKTCSESTPPCIMDIDVDSMGTPKVKDVKGVPDCGEVVPHVRSMHANALDKGDTLTDIHKTITQLDEAASYAKDAQAKARADIEDPDIPAEYKTKIEAEAKHAQTVIDFAEKHKQKTKEAGKAVNAVESWKGVPKDVKLKVKEVSLQAAKDDKEALGSLGKATGLHQDAYLAVAKIAQKEAAAVEAEALKKRAAADAAARKAAAKAAEAAKKAAEEKAAKEAAEAAAAAKKAAEEAAAAAKAAEEAAAKAKKEAEEKARRAGMTPAWQQPSETWSEWPKNPWGSKYWLSKTLDSCGTLLEKQSFSLSLWANLRKLAFGTEAYLIATHGPKGARSYLQFGIHDPPSGNPGIFFRMRNGCAVRAPIKKNVEHHYVATFDAATMTQKIFFDGKLLQTCTAEIPFQCPSKDLYVGCWAPQGAPPESGCEYHMVGDMRATKIFSGKALTSNDIQDEFKRGPVASESTEEKTEKTEKKKSEVSFRAEAGLCRNNVDGKWHLGTFGAYCGIPGPKRIRKDGKWVFTDAECKKACADYEPCKAANVQKYSPCELFTGKTSGKPDDCPEGFAPGPPNAPEGNPKPDEYFGKEYPPTDTAGTGSFCYIKESGAAAAAAPAKCKNDIALNFNDQPLGKCPSGWTCKGSNIKVCWHGGHNGNCHDGSLGGTSDSPSDPRWFYAGNDQDTGEARSDDFVLPKGASSVTMLRAGMSNWHHDQGSGIWLKSAVDDSALCDFNENVAGWSFKKVTCKGLDSHAGKEVYIFVKNGKKGGWGKLFFDDIRFVGADGAALKGGSIDCD